MCKVKSALVPVYEVEVYECRCTEDEEMVEPLWRWVPEEGYWECYGCGDVA